MIIKTLLATSLHELTVVSFLVSLEVCKSKNVNVTAMLLHGPWLQLSSVLQ